MQRVERARIAASSRRTKRSGARTLAQPCAEVPVFGVLDREAVAHVAANDLGEAVENAERPDSRTEQLGEVGLAKPRRIDGR